MSHNKNNEFLKTITIIRLKICIKVFHIYDDTKKFASICRWKGFTQRKKSKPWIVYCRIQEHHRNSAEKNRGTMGTWKRRFVELTEKSTTVNSDKTRVRGGNNRINAAECAPSKIARSSHSWRTEDHNWIAVSSTKMNIYRGSDGTLGIADSIVLTKDHRVLWVESVRKKLNKTNTGGSTTTISVED